MFYIELHNIQLMYFQKVRDRERELEIDGCYLQPMLKKQFICIYGILKMHILLSFNIYEIYWQGSFYMKHTQHSYYKRFGLHFRLCSEMQLVTIICHTGAYSQNVLLLIFNKHYLNSSTSAPVACHVCVYARIKDYQVGSKYNMFSSKPSKVKYLKTNTNQANKNTKKQNKGS